MPTEDVSLTGKVILGVCGAIVGLLLLALIIAAGAVDKDSRRPHHDGGGGVQPYPFYRVSHLPPQLGAVAAANNICMNVGEDIVLLGGNALDAAIAMAFCQGVVQPESSGLGGGGLMNLLLPNGTRYLLDFREQAPLAATPTMFVNNSLGAQNGVQSAGMPGELLGMYTAWERFGNLSWAALIAPAVNLSRDGFAVSPHLAAALVATETKVRADPGLTAQFVLPDGKLAKFDDVVSNHLLSATLQEIADYGPDCFYKPSAAGSASPNLGARLLADIAAAGGLLTEADFLAYKTVDRQPLSTWFRGVEIVVPPAPFGGPVMLMALNLLEPYAQISGWERSCAAEHLMSEALRFSFADRTYLADPAFEPAVDDIQEVMINKDYASAVRQHLSATHSFPPTHYFDGKAPTAAEEDHGTLHISAIDKDGFAVSFTTTVNLNFGSGWTSQSTGLLLNDQLDDFSIPGHSNAFGYEPSAANFMYPLKRPLSSMTPTIALRNDRPIFITGAAGGSTIISVTMQILINTLVYGQNATEAIHSYRIHDQVLPDVLKTEAKACEEVLRKTYHHTEVRRVAKLGAAAAVEILPDLDANGLQLDTFKAYGASDYRLQESG